MFDGKHNTKNQLIYPNAHSSHAKKSKDDLAAAQK